MTATELAENPFFVLGISTRATRMDIERAGQKLLAQLTIGATASRVYLTPFGPRERDEHKVRKAVAALRSPEERLLHELWADAVEFNADAPPRFDWDPAFRSIHWSGPCTAR